MIDTRSIRSLDDVGRVMIPRDIRRLVGWQPNEMVVIETDGEVVTLHRARAGPAGHTMIGGLCK